MLPSRLAEGTRLVIRSVFSTLSTYRMRVKLMKKLVITGKAIGLPPAFLALEEGSKGGGVIEVGFDCANERVSISAWPKKRLCVRMSVCPPVHSACSPQLAFDWFDRFLVKIKKKQVEFWVHRFRYCKVWLNIGFIGIVLGKPHLRISFGLDHLKCACIVHVI